MSMTNDPSKTRVRRRGSRAQYEEWKAKRREEEGRAKPKKAALPAASRRGTKKKKGPSRSWGALLRSCWTLIHADRIAVAVSIGTLTVSSLLGLLTPASTKFVIDYVFTDSPGPAGIPAWLGLPQDRAQLLWIMSGALLVATLIEIVLRVWGRYLINRVRRRLQVTLRRDTFAHAMKLPLGRVFDLKSGGLASLLRTDVGGAADLLLNLLWNPWRSIIRLVGTLAVLALVDVSFLIGSMLFLILVFLSHRGFVGRIRSLWRDIRKTRSVIDGHATEAFGGMRVVRTFRRQRSEGRRFVEGNALVARQEMLAWWLSRVIELVWALLVPVATTLVLLYGGLRVINHTLTIGDVMMFTTYLALLLAPVEQLVQSATNIQNNLAALDRVLDLLEEPTEFADQSEHFRLTDDEVRGAYTFEDVWFRYSDDTKGVLEGVTINIEAGQTIALVGPSGAGKTTLLQLVARFYDPDRGVVKFDGRDLKTIDIDSYRSQLAIVDQDLFLFDGPLRENIAYARPDASHDDIVAAAKLAAAHDFIMEFPQGYETEVGERGVKLSGGQRQRIAIARAALKNPRVLLLDEATSHLDSESEEVVQEGLRNLIVGRTSFIIAHRLSTVRDADRILVLDHGRVVEDGTHAELVQNEGRYFELLQAQL